jgi:hypothetical protein
VERFTAIGVERQALGYDAHVGGSKEAKAKLAKLVEEEVALNGTVQSLDGALAEARTRLTAAQEAAAREAAKANAKEIRKLLATFQSTAADIDASLEDFARLTHDLRDVVNKLHSLGCEFPNHNQIESLGSRAVLTAVGKSIFKRAVPVLAPGERRTFAPLVAGWCRNIEDGIAPLLGEQTTRNIKAA